MLLVIHYALTGTYSNLYADKFINFIFVYACKMKILVSFFFLDFFCSNSIESTGSL